MAYSIFETELFKKQMKVLCKKDKPLEQQLREVIRTIAENPENFDSSLQGNRQRSVKKKAVKQHYRIIYRFCVRCIKVHKSACDGCPVANELESAVVFEEVFHRDDGY